MNPIIKVIAWIVNFPHGINGKGVEGGVKKTKMCRKCGWWHQGKCGLIDKIKCWWENKRKENE